jgi:DNA-3-methyladenine glycosylase I
MIAMAHLFAYGSLMCDAIMARVAGALPARSAGVLENFRRHPVQGELYPAIVPHPGGRVPGVVYHDLGAEGWQRLDRFEGPQYTRRRVRVRLESGERLEAQTYVAKAPLRRRLEPGDWDYARFLVEGRPAFERDYPGYRTLPATQSAPPAVQRCPWAEGSALERDYHDTEWGVPLHDDRRLFEFLVLEGAQAGLSWSTILRKREAYREAFQRFDPHLVARFGVQDLERLMGDAGIVRNRAKIAAAVTNARAFLQVQERFDSFDRYLWRFVEGCTIRNAWERPDQVPARTPESERLSRDLRQRGFAFVGPTICYALMQAVGMVNDHLATCFRHRALGGGDRPA